MSALTPRAIAGALGGDLTGRHTVLCPGPRHSRHDRSLAVRIDPRAPDGFVTYSHAGDDWRECRDLVRSRLGLPAWQPGEDDRQRSIPSQHVSRWDFEVGKQEWSEPPTADDLERISRAREIWDEARDPRGSLVETYLRSRALDLTDELAGKVLRFHPRCPWRSEDTGLTDCVPALVAAFRSIKDDEISGIHRIALHPDGGKIGRRMLGIIRGAAVKLAPITAGLLAIGEGVETAMAAQQLGVRPAWALGSVGAIAFFPMIDGVQRLVLLGETGQSSADAIMQCGARWRKVGRKVQVRMPRAGSDLNDELMAVAQ